MRSWSFLQSHLLEVSEASTRYWLEALEITATTCDPKERALSMVTPRNFGREVVLRVVPHICNDGCQRAFFEVLVKKATSHLLVLRVSFAAPAPFCHFRYGFLYGCFSDFFIGVAAEERNIVGKHLLLLFGQSAKSSLAQEGRLATSP